MTRAAAYYNEFDPEAAATLREQIKRGQIAAGDVDERDIRDVKPAELRPYAQCHFFAGIGIWSRALRLAGWEDNRAVWTFSCPCQPFSAAGKGAGFADDRHLWPAQLHLLRNAKPRGVPCYGEQVASDDGLAWLDVVFADLAGEGNTIWPFDLCAAGFGAPHQRQRLFFMANAAGPRPLPGPQRGLHRAEESRGARHEESKRLRATVALGHPDGVGPARGEAGNETGAESAAQGRGENEGRGRHVAADDEQSGELGNAIGAGLEGHAGHGDRARGRQEQAGPAAPAGVSGGVADAVRDRREHGEALAGSDGARAGEGRQGHQSGAHGEPRMRPGPVNGFWRDADWLFCRDGFWRAVEPSTFPLAHGVAARAGRIRCYGNGIVAQVAEGFIRASGEEAGRVMV